jgi:hypothetical protein
MAERPKELPKPVGIALVLCDNVYTESAGKQALIGLFNRIMAKKFPATHPRLCVFVSLTEVMPGTKCQLDIVHSETDEPVVRIEGPMPEGPGPIAVWDVVFPLETLVFMEPGTYYVRFFGNGQIILQRPFEVVLIDGRNSHEPDKRD